MTLALQTKYMLSAAGNVISLYIRSMALRKSSISHYGHLQLTNSSLGQAGFGTVDHDLHRLRRIPLAKFFSRAMIARLEPELHVLVQKICDKLLAQSGANKPFDITMAYSCFTSDAISSYSFGESF